MSFNLIPGLKGNGNRRATDRVAELRDENRTLLTRQMAADDYFALLIQDRDDVYAAWQQEKELRGEAEEAAAQMRMERDEAIEERDTLTAETEYLRKRLAPHLAAEANANRIHVPPMERDTSDPADQATVPIPVITRVMPLYQAPFATEPVFEVLSASADPTIVPASALRP